MVARAPGPALTSTSTVDPLAQFLHDELTALGSLLTLRRDLELLIDRFQPFGTRPALYLIDVDQFGRLNAAHGGALGDEVLKVTAGRLRAILADTDGAYRTGGDEFAAVIQSIPMLEAVAAAGRLQQALSQPVPVQGTTIPLSVSVAVVMLGHRHRVDELLRDADVTMYRAKTEGGNRVDIYNWEVDSWTNARRKDAERLEKEVAELRAQNRVLTEALTLDLATGMPNAIAFEADHRQVEAWRRRSGEPYSILRVSVDGASDLAFHSQGGAETLNRIARLVRDTIRLSDRAYVLAGGDLIVLLRGSVMKQAVAAAERIRIAVAGLAETHPADADLTPTVTVAAIEAGFRHDDCSAVLREVDSLLQAAVAAGGARIVWPH